MRILEAQRAISLDTMFQLADHMEGLSHGEKLNTALVNRLAGGIAEIQAPRAPLTGAERTAMGFGYWTERHIDAERKLNLRAAIEKAAGDAEKLKDARGLMAPLLRDTLVAFNYAHYAPPGAQILYTNPVFVRSHDFVGAEGASHTWRPTELFGTGWPSNGGGRLVGSLSTLPYALAEAEQNFLIPEHTQALIWGDLAPQMILDAKIPRWWNVTPAQVHWVGLHLRYGRELLAESAFDAELRAQVLDSLSQTGPARAHAGGGGLDRAGRGEGCGGACDALGAVLAGAGHGFAAGLRRQLLHPGGTAPTGPGIAPGSELRSHIPGLRHAQADTGEFLRAGAAQPAHVPHVDGVLEPHDGGELGIEHAYTGRPWPTN